MKKKIFFNYFLFLVAALTIGLIFSGCQSPDATSDAKPVPGDAPIVLRLSSFASPTHLVYTDHIVPFVEKMEERTGGRLKFDVHIAQELVPMGKEYESLKAGTIDVAYTLMYAYKPEMWPLADITLLPNVGGTATIAARALQKLADSDVPLKDGKTWYDLTAGQYGLKVWPGAATGPYVLATTGQRFQSVDDFRGTVMRGSARVHLIYLEKLGCMVVTMPSAEMYDALARGTIDGSLFSIADWIGFGFQEVFKYVVDGYSVGHFNCVIAMTEETWNKLPPDIQQIWEDTAREQLLEGAQAFIDAEMPVREAAMNLGCVFEDIKDLNPDIRAHLERADLETWKEWIQVLEKEGHPGSAAAELWAQFLIEEGASVPQGLEKLWQ